ncbi:metal-dependent hydrolase [Chloroflexia bacterium SDU3-3]|nr:metal-dependent hydrolase [Chloroflexia bacterium SDU3-3]
MTMWRTARAISTRSRARWPPRRSEGAPMSIHEQIELLRRFPAELAALVEHLTPEQLGTPYLAGEWTVAQNVHHLADAHMHAYLRCKFAVTQENPTVKPFDQDAWAAQPDAAELDITPSMALLRGLHVRMTSFFASLPDEAWQRPFYHPERGPMVVSDMLASVAAHCVAHTDQITRTLAAAK